MKCFSPKTKCLVIKSYNGELFVTIDEHIFELRELRRNERFSKEFDDVIEHREKSTYKSCICLSWFLCRENF